MRFVILSLLSFLLSLQLFENGTTAQTPNWQTEIYDNQWLNGEPVVRRTDGRIDFQWGGGSPSGGVESDFFSIRWTSSLYLNDNSRIRFNVQADDGIRVFVDGQTVLYAWEGQAKAGAAADRWLSAGNHTVVVEYYEHSGNAYAFFDYVTVETDADRPDLIPTVTPSVQLPTSTPVPFVTETAHPQLTSTPVPSTTNTPWPTSTSAPTMTNTPWPTSTSTSQLTSTATPFVTETPHATPIINLTLFLTATPRTMSPAATTTYKGIHHCNFIP